MIGEVDAVVCDIFEDKGNLRPPDNPAKRTPVLGNGVEVAAEGIEVIVGCRNGISARIASVIYRIGLDAGIEALILEITLEYMLHIVDLV